MALGANKLDINTIWIIIHASISLILLLTGMVFIDGAGLKSNAIQLEAAHLMDRSLDKVAEYCQNHNINTNDFIDPLKSGLIGPEWTEIATTVGHLDAKRSTINPNFAALIVTFLKDAGVEKGDTIAIASSGSFPALLVASISASTALGLHARLIISIGASSHGATNPAFTLLDLYHLLGQSTAQNTELVGVSLGGQKDIGKEFEPETRSSLIKKVQAFGANLIYEEELSTNLGLRHSLYSSGCISCIKAFINAGGSETSMGTSPLSLSLKPGLITYAQLPEDSQQGMIYSMIAQDIPVIHLLYIKGLAQKYGLVWDSTKRPSIQEHNRFNESAISMVFLIFCIIGVIYGAIIIFHLNVLSKRR